MCKFTNRLFVFALLAFLGDHWFCAVAAAAPLTAFYAPPSDAGRSSSILDFLMPDNDYDLNYDQRQKGEENVRLKLDGFFIGMPAEESSELMLITDDILEGLGEELLLGLGKSRSTTPSPDNSLSYKIAAADASHKFLVGDHQKPPDTIIVEIPAPRRDFEARNSLRNDQLPAEDQYNGLRTKHHVYQLLNLLKRSRRD